MFSRIFRVLMWRVYLSRKRQYFATVIELVLPVLFFVPAFVFRRKLFSGTYTQQPELADMMETAKTFLMFLACDFGMIPIYYGFISRILIERASGVQEIMKMMGVTSKALILSHILNSLVPGLIFSIGGTLMLTNGPDAIYDKTQAIIFFLALFLHYFSLISIGMVVSYIGFKVQTVAISLGSYVLLTTPAYFLIQHLLPAHFVYPLGLLFAMPIAWVLRQAAGAEIAGKGLTFASMANVHSKHSGPAALAFVFVLVQIVVCWLLCWYLDHVIAGVYGSALPFDFLCQKEYWSKTLPEPAVESRATQVQEQKYFETPPGNLEVGIKAINVTKDFNKKTRALDNLSLDIYKGEITILLGHNGAGKTTLMSVITGMMGATTGKVLVNGLDIMTQKEQARKHIGLCPQQNMFLDNLTVIEHAMFFMLIKRGTFAEARKSSEELLDQLHIRDKADNDTAKLSGGMKRRVQLACALAGHASVVLLDEPTAGLDVETRRSMWDLLLSFRGSRTVLLSTHFMEEADALGDRVAALHAGSLRCFATPMYLKRALGTGYRMTFTTTEKANESAITNVIKSVVPDAEVREAGFNSISYNLPLANTKSFPSLFSKLESKQSELGIQSIGVGVSTLEEVFLQLCSGFVDKPPEETPDIQGGPTYEKLSGVPLLIAHFRALFRRHVKFMLRHSFTQITYGMIIVPLLIILVSYANNDKATSKGKKTLRVMDMETYSASPDASPVYLESDTDLRIVGNMYPQVYFVGFSNDSKVLSVNKHDIMVYRNDSDVNDKDTEVMTFFTDSAGYSAPLNVLASRLAAHAHPKTAVRVHHPSMQTVGTRQAAATFKSPKSLQKSFVWTYMVIMFTLIVMCGMIALPSMEFASGARVAHILAGCSPEMHWGALLLITTVQIAMTLGLAVVIGCAFLDRDNTFDDVNFIVAVVAVLLLSCTATLVASYQLTFTASTNIVEGVLLLMQLFFALIFPIIIAVKPVDILEMAVEIIVPQFTFFKAMLVCNGGARMNALCKLNRDKCPLTDALNKNFAGGKCCGSKGNPFSYFSFGTYGVAKHILILIGQIIAYMTLLLLRQRGALGLLWEKTMNAKYTAPTPRFNDENVKTEQMYVNQAINQPTKEDQDKMLVSNVHKNYVSIFIWKQFNAVKGVSFSVKKGECFGLLGVNGAGKSSMFQMLTVSECVTKGRIMANTHHLNIPRTTKYLQSLAYCPQFWGLDLFLTGQHNLEILLIFNGLNSRDATTEAMAWIKLVDLVRYADRHVSEYSGGCMRRMAAAGALCTGAPVTLLDEPTAGVDVAARRSVWFALKRALHERRSIVITSHSLDEMESLCHRIAIMAAGEVCALGSPAALQAASAVGHTIIFKLNHEADEEAKLLKVDQLKRAIENKFNCVLKDEHKTMLHYHIKETMHYSKLFQDMEALQSQFPGFIDDYSVSATTLEDVFISFAKAQEEVNKEENAKKAGPA